VPGLVTRDLGEATPGVPISFDAPVGTLGFNVVAEGASGQRIAFDLTAPTGAPVFLDFTPENAGSFSGMAAISVPQNDRALALPAFEGEWTIAVHAMEAVRLSVAIQVTEDGRFHGGTLDLHLYVPDGLEIADPTPLHAVTAVEAESDTAVATRVDGYFALLESLFAIRRGRVEFHAVDASFRHITTPRQLLDLFAASSAPDGQAMHIMLSNEIADIGSPTIGVSAGVPGAATRARTPLSAVAVAVSPDVSASLAPIVMLHETSHFLGLTHTSDQGGRFDPLGDTPQCADLSALRISRCPDLTNLLFPLPLAHELGKAVVVADSQRAIVQSSPLIKQAQ
jgi:hypothetical protein